MKRHLIFGAGLALLGAFTASAQTYTNEPASVAWDFNSVDHFSEVTSVTPAGGFSVTAVDAGDLEVTGTGTGTTVPGVTFVKLKPSGQSTSVDWYVKPAKGLEFTPTHVSLYIQRFGTDAQNGVTVTARLADGTDEALGNFTAPRNNKSQADDKYGSSDNYTSLVDITLTPEQQQKFTSGEGFYINATVGVGSAKEGGFADVHIDGLLNGSVEAVAKYTVTAVASPEEAGAVTISPKADVYDEGAQVKIETKKNFGYEFINWTDATGAVVSTETEFVYDVTGAAAFTANYRKLATYALDYSVSGGAATYMVQPSPAPTVVDGRNMYEEGTKVTLTALSNYVITFNSWSNGETSPEISFVMDGDKSYGADYSASDFLAGWDFYLPGNNGRAADFASADNEAANLVLRDADGNNYSWLDKSAQAAGGYEGRAGAAVNWVTAVPVGTAYWQTRLNASAFTGLKVFSAMAYNYNAYTKYDVQYSADGDTWTTIGSFEIPGTKNWIEEEFELPADADNRSEVYIRWIADLSSEKNGTSSNNDGICLADVYVTGTARLVDDGTAPVLVSTVPAAGATTASANGKIVLTFDEKVKVADGAVATLAGMELKPVVAGKTVMFEYKGLSYATPYTFNLPAGSVADLTDNYLNQEITISFTTKTRPVVEKQLYDFIVPDNGTFKEAIAAASKRANTSARFRIFVRKGNYQLPVDEKATVTGSDGVAYPSPITVLNTPNVSIIGEDMDATVIVNTVPEVTAGANPIEGLGKCETLSLTSAASGTYFQDITLKNGLKDATGRGAALEDASNKTICKNVVLHGYQDTYLSNNASGKFYFEGGRLRGRTDFLCGKGDVYYNAVNLVMCEKGGYLAVPSNPKKYGYIFSDCTITGEKNDINGNYTLGRPWGKGTPIALYINTVMEVQPSAVGWNEMSGGWPARFAEYGSVTPSGTPLDLSNRKRIFADTYENDPILTKEEADQMTLAAVMGQDDDWDPTEATEQASAPVDAVISGNVITWADSNYALLWAVSRDGEIIGFTTVPSFTVDSAEGLYTVRAANEMGGLGEAAVVSPASSITDVTVVAPVATRYYNLQGVPVASDDRGALIRVDILPDGTRTASKVIR